MKQWKRKSYSPEATVDKATKGEKRLSHSCRVHGLSGQDEWFCLLTESSLLPRTPQVLWGMGLADSPQNQIAKELVTAGHEGRWTGTPTPTAAATPKTCPTHFQASKSWCPFQKFLSPSGLSLRQEQIRLTLNSGIWQTVTELGTGPKNSSSLWDLGKSLYSISHHFSLCTSTSFHDQRGLSAH